MGEFASRAASRAVFSQTHSTFDPVSVILLATTVEDEVT
jgi:hypothetical protein